jgi:hypothetical protein
MHCKNKQQRGEELFGDSDEADGEDLGDEGDNEDDDSVLSGAGVLGAREGAGGATAAGAVPSTAGVVLPIVTLARS